jgi:hypothetical protein
MVLDPVVVTAEFDTLAGLPLTRRTSLGAVSDQSGDHGEEPTTRSLMRGLC